MIRRRRARINDLKKFLTEELGLIKLEEINEHFDRLKSKNDFSVTNDKYKNEINPLNLRYKVIKNQEKLSPLQLSIVMISFAKRRGYENKFSFETDEGGYGSSSSKFIGKEKGKYQFPIQAIMEDDFFKSKNIGKEQELFYRNRKRDEKKISKDDENFKSKREQILFLTNDNKNELKKILDVQKNFYVELTDKVINEVVETIIFRKRDFEDGPGPKNEQNRDS